jgi:hypothetical protein
MTNHNLELCSVYRIIHFNNLESILIEKGLWCSNHMIKESKDYTQIGNQNLTRQRSEVSVPNTNHSLNDYVPFYFGTKSHMLYQIHTGYVETYTGGQEAIIYLVTNIDTIRKSNLKFCFTDMHAKKAVARFHSDIQSLHVLDWEAIRSNDFKHRDEDPGRSTRRQAEFLVHEFVPIETILGIAVFSDRWKTDCEQLLDRHNVQIPVKIMTKWYFN